MIRALKHRVIWSLLLLGGLMVVTQLWSLSRVYQQNALITELLSGQDIALDQVVTAAPQIRLARAGYLRQKQRYNEALDTLSLIVGQGDKRLQAQTRYNLGNVYLAQAMTELEAGRLNQTMPLLNLAKQAYRQALTLDSGFWDAKYNLELAMHWLPEFDRVSNAQPDEEVAQPAQIWTTLPGFPRGLP